jgi:hypothetical protein
LTGAEPWELDTLRFSIKKPAGWAGGTFQIFEVIGAAVRVWLEAAAGEREFLIHALRCATARARLVVNVLETVGVSLRHKAVTTDQAMAWLAEENVVQHVELDLPGGRK